MQMLVKYLGVGGDSQYDDNAEIVEVADRPDPAKMAQAAVVEFNRKRGSRIYGAEHYSVEPANNPWPLKVVTQPENPPSEAGVVPFTVPSDGLVVR